MRTRTLLLITIALAAAVPTGTAHRDHCQGDSLCHLTLNVQELPAGGEHSYTLHSERVTGDFPVGWIVTTYAGVQGEGAILANLTVDNETRHTWIWNGNQYNSNSTRLSHAGHYQLKLHNPGSEAVRYGFYFDQSCNCAAKVIPINGGFVLFNYDLPADRGVKLGFPTIDGWHVKGQLAVLEDDQGRWPDDFRVLQTQEQKNKGWLEFDFQTEAEGTYYVFIEAIEGVRTGPDGRPVPVELTPLLEVEAAKSPAMGVMGLILAITIGVAWARRR